MGTADQPAPRGEELRFIACNTNGRPLANAIARADLSIEPATTPVNGHPLHNNLSEGHVRDYVKKRKISGSTRSELGRSARDTFASLKKTCRRLGVNFWEYLQDRVRGLGQIPRLADQLRQKAEEAARKAPAALPPGP